MLLYGFLPPNLATTNVYHPPKPVPTPIPKALDKYAAYCFSRIPVHRCKGSSTLGHEIGHFHSFRSPQSCHTVLLILDIATDSLVRSHHLVSHRSLPLLCMPVPSALVGRPSLPTPFQFQIDNIPRSFRCSPTATLTASSVRS